MTRRAERPERPQHERAQAASVPKPERASPRRCGAGAARWRGGYALLPAALAEGLVPGLQQIAERDQLGAGIQPNRERILSALLTLQCLKQQRYGFPDPILSGKPSQL